MMMLTKRGLVLSLVLALCAPCKSAGAQDACASLFAVPSPHLSRSDGRCDLDSARAHFHSQVSPACAQAARAGAAAESMERLRCQAMARPSQAPCDDAWHQLAMYALCALRPPNQSEQFRKVISSSLISNDQGRDPMVVSECLLALLELESGASLRALSMQLSEGALSSEVLERVAKNASPMVAEQLAPLLHSANERRSQGRDRLHELLCRRRPVTTPNLSAACAQSSGHDEVRTYQAEVKQQRRKRLGLRIGLTLMSLTVAGLQVGLTIPYRAQATGQAMATFGGVTSGLFMVTDIMLIANPPHDEGAASFFWPFPFGAAGAAIAFPTLLLMTLPPSAGGAAAYGTAQSPTGAVVSSSLSAAFSLASALALTWML